ncbi:MAG TPA: SOS response-associated peptidase [Burkholderiales bacterium]|nr:SOS response-associated peptidase [Burkholderiales bacterium]
MCGRYVLDDDGSIIAYIYGVPRSRETGIVRRYNIAPGQRAPIIRHDEAGRRVDLIRWGLIPFWAKSEKVGYNLINARGDTVAEKPAFRQAFKRRRCLIPASGFYEWQTTAGSRIKTPHYITLQSGELMTFAGLWESWKNAADEQIETFTIITTDANELLAKLHNRMPDILDRRDWDTWLNPNASEATLLPLIHPYPSDEMRAWPVSTRVNKPSADVPALIAPA